MTIAIEDISRTEQLDREELSSVRGGIALIPVDSPPGDGSMPPFPAFPSGFPFNGSSPLDPGPGAIGSWLQSARPPDDAACVD